MSFQYAYYNEHEPFAAQWLRNLIEAKLIAPGYVDERDIQDVQVDDLQGFWQHHFFAGIGGWSYALRLAGWPDDRPVVTGSCPCQPFSVAGSKVGNRDPRHLWPEFFRLIKQQRPRQIFGEQVASSAGLAWFDDVSTDLEGAGYSIGAADLCAAGVGAPHIRQRLYWVAHPPKGRLRIDGSTPGETGHASQCESVGQLDNASKPRGGRNARAVGEARHIANQSGVASAAIPLADTYLGESGYRKLQRSWRLVQPAKNPLTGFWRSSEWVTCNDGKTRPIEPGSFPLAYGVSARMGRLRAYGNAIVPQVAEAFIRSYMSDNHE